MQARMLAPAAALVVWSLIVLLWMMVTRFSAFSKAGIDLSKAPPGGRGANLEGVLPDRVNWKAHNYAHLMEEPTIFYPTVINLALSGATTLDVALAWAYAGIRLSIRCGRGWSTACRSGSCSSHSRPCASSR